MFLIKSGQRGLSYPLPLSARQVCLPGNSIPLSLYEVKYAILGPIQFVKGHLVHYHVLLAVRSLENHVLSVGGAVRYSIHPYVPFVHFALSHFNLVVQFPLNFLTILFALESSNLPRSQVCLEKVHVDRLCCFSRFLDRLALARTGNMFR